MFNDSPETPVFTLPPIKVTQIMTTMSQAMDWGLQQLGIPDVWSRTQGEEQACLVIDTGMPNHPDLEKCLLKDLCRDFTGEGLDDGNGHSTFVSSIIAASNDENGVVGYAPMGKIITAKVLDSSGTGSSQNVMEALKYAHQISDKLSVINMSLGARYSTPGMREIIQAIVAKGVPVICAAGNEQRNCNAETLCYPGAYPEVIAIAAYDKNGNLGNFSSWGKEVDLAFPGVDNIGCGLNGTYVKMSGTSFASPACAAVVMLVKALHKRLKNLTLTPEQVKEHLYNFAVSKSEEGRDIKWGYGIVDTKKLIFEDLDLR